MNVPADLGLSVSVIVPCYNGEAFLAECLDSIFGQDRPPEEVVLVDDGIAVAVLTNQDAIGAASTISHLAAQALLGQATGTAEEKQALAIFHDLQKGKIDRSLLAPNLNDYFTAEALTDFQASLGPLGEPLSFRQTGSSLRGGMTFHGFAITYPNQKLRLTTYTYPDGKLEQYLIAPAD